MKVQITHLAHLKTVDGDRVGLHQSLGVVVHGVKDPFGFEDIVAFQERDAPVETGHGNHDQRAGNKFFGGTNFEHG